MDETCDEFMIYTKIIQTKLNSQIAGLGSTIELSLKIQG